MLKQIPNALTLLRLVLAPVIAWLMWQGMKPLPPEAFDGDALYTSHAEAAASAMSVAAVLFVIAALSDLFDGMAARAFNAHSKFGRIIDPIADKVLVGLPLTVASLAAILRNWPIWQVMVIATAVIVLRDVTMTIVRLASPDGEGARVSSLAKTKTALELILIGALLLAGVVVTSQIAKAPPLYPHYQWEIGYVWLGLLVVTAALSAWTAWQYLAPKPKP